MIWIVTVTTTDDVVVHVRCDTPELAAMVRDQVVGVFDQIQVDERPDDWDCPDPGHRTFSRPPLN